MTSVSSNPLTCKRDFHGPRLDFDVQVITRMAMCSCSPKILYSSRIPEYSPFDLSFHDVTAVVK